MAKRGRPPILDELKRREILAILTVGCRRRTAAKYVGCTVQTISNTAARDPDFAKQVRQAEQQAEIGALKEIREAGKEPRHWRAAAWLLERRNPDRLRAAQAERGYHRTGPPTAEPVRPNHCRGGTGAEVPPTGSQASQRVAGGRSSRAERAKGR